MKSFLFSIPLIFLLLACNNDDDLAPSGGVFIRVENDSTVPFGNIIVNTDGEYDYGNLEVGALSEYQEHGLAYRYAYVSLEIYGVEYAIQPIDFVGETPLDNGSYTYILTFNETFSQLSIQLRED